MLLTHWRGRRLTGTRYANSSEIKIKLIKQDAEIDRIRKAFQLDAYATPYSTFIY